MKINHEELEKLEYKGEYGCRYTCGNCKSFGIDNDYNLCDKQGLEVSCHNNVCRKFQPKITNPSSPEFNFDDYLEFLGSDFYRPYGIDESIIVSYIDRPSFYTHDKRHKIPIYKTYDKPYCKVSMKRCYVKYKDHRFEIDYKRFRELKTIENGIIHFDVHLWKDKPSQRKFNKEVFGIFTKEE